jgi:hypothetical protein
MEDAVNRQLRCFDGAQATLFLVFSTFNHHGNSLNRQFTLEPLLKSACQGANFPNSGSS